uniref:Uncharacterized protein n=1 Tax=Ditylenchus dipsaci TaxID=166011 RepID=A0A915E0F7_9BILA
MLSLTAIAKRGIGSVAFIFTVKGSSCSDFDCRFDDFTISGGGKGWYVQEPPEAAPAAGAAAADATVLADGGAGVVAGAVTPGNKRIVVKT